MDVLVNADDLGLNPKVNEAIFNMMADGIITSASILANAPYVEEACARLESFPYCSFGVHLNVTEFNPLVPADGLDSILNDQGEFTKEGVRQAKIGNGLAEGIFREYCAQIERLQELGVKLSHIDSHHYVHTIPRVFPILKKVQKLFQVRRVRITRNVYADGLLKETGLSPYQLGIDPDLGDQDVSRALRLKKTLYNFMLRHYYSTKTTDGFSGFRLFYELGKIHKMGQRTFEVVVHPANQYYDAEEAEILTGSWRNDMKFPVRLINDYDLVFTK